MPQRARGELDDLLKKADQVTKESQELQAKLKAEMTERARVNRPAKATADATMTKLGKRSPTKRR